jgi:hypothetical protein
METINRYVGDNVHLVSLPRNLQLNGILDASKILFSVESRDTKVSESLLISIAKQQLGLPVMRIM